MRPKRFQARSYRKLSFEPPAKSNAKGSHKNARKSTKRGEVCYRLMYREIQTETPTQMRFSSCLFAPFCGCFMSYCMRLNSQRSAIITYQTRELSGVAVL